MTGNIGTTAIITSYFTLVSFPGNTTGANINQDFPVTVPLSTSGTGQYRIVLSWGNAPSDLDSHLTGPTATSGRFHTYYNSHSYPINSAANTSGRIYTAGSTTEAFLDVDNVNHGIDNGPETTTIAIPRVGTYKFYVHHYPGDSNILNISSAGAQVKVYKGNALLATFNPPATATGINDVWSVFTMDVTSTGESISPVNSIFNSGTSSPSLAKAAGSSFDEYFLFSNLPGK